MTMSETRRKHYLEHAQENSVSVFFSGVAPQRSSDQSYPFSVNRNFHYLSGIDQENAILMVIKGSSSEGTLLFIKRPDPEKALWDGETLTFGQAAELSGLDVGSIRDIDTFKETLHGILSVTRKAVYGMIETIHIDLGQQSAESPRTEAQRFASYVRDTYPGLSIKPSQTILARLRMVKDDTELDAITRAIRVTRDGLLNIMAVLKENMREYEAEAVFDYMLKKNNMTPGFQTIAASGKNATVLHYVTNSDLIAKDACVLFDLGAEHANYNADITRVYPASGTFTPRQKAIYDVVLEANKKTIAWLKAGVSFKEFNDYGKKILIEGARRLGLIKEDHEISKYYYHSLGHYLGLDVHDVGDYSMPIPEGAVLTVEPGLYVAEEGIGVRIEDDVLITKDGAVNLSKDIPKETEEIESIMKRS
jgi:Xaa-Pro aminopeptidase